MKLITDLTENKSHQLTGNGSYERWYFDGIDDQNEYMFVIIFYKSNPFSPVYNKRVKNHSENPESEKPNPLEHSAISINMYLKSRVLYKMFYEFSRNKFSIEKMDDDEKIFLEKSSFYFNSKENKYHLNINFSEPDDSTKKFKAEFTFSPKSDCSALERNNTNDKTNHYWQPSASVCNVNGKLKSYKDFKRKKTDFTGFGYCDHVWGDEAIFRNIKQWYWGRVISNEYSAVYLYIRYDKNYSKDFKKILVYRNDKLILEEDEFEIKIKKSRNYWMLHYPTDVIIETGDFKLISSNESKLDNTPYYIRFLTKNNLFIKNNKEIIDAPGFSEFINPKRLTSDFFKVFIDMKIKRSE